MSLVDSVEDILRFVAVTLLVCPTASNSAAGQWMGKQTGCYAHSVSANPIAAHPNRPTVANPVDITQYGRFGTGVWLGSPMARRGYPADVCWRSLEARDPLRRRVALEHNFICVTDGPKRYTRRVRRQLAWSADPNLSADPTENGLGTGRVDHAFPFLASKDIKRFHVDFNVTEFLIGRAGCVRLRQEPADESCLFARHPRRTRG